MNGLLGRVVVIVVCDVTTGRFRISRLFVLAFVTRAGFGLLWKNELNRKGFAIRGAYLFF